MSLPESIGDPPIGLLRVMYAEVYRDTVKVHVMYDLGVQRNSLEHSLVKTEEGWKIDGEQRLFYEIEGGAATNVVCDLVRLRVEARSHDRPFLERIVREIDKAFSRAAKKVRSTSGRCGKVRIDGTLDY